MRLDKFLKVSRLIRRRTLAKQVADQGRITVNGNVAKASTRLAVGDEMAIQFGQTLLTVEITHLKEHVRKDEATQLYKVIKEEKINRN
ncbi:MAG TPA: RNA-binding S4 domain-containing protein [Virgibacillus sp.]|nr:RNA-binding S4 domain-containing protein [Virgibacillus sp.]